MGIKGAEVSTKGQVGTKGRKGYKVEGNEYKGAEVYTKRRKGYKGTQSGLKGYKVAHSSANCIINILLHFECGEFYITRHKMVQMGLIFRGHHFFNK